MTAQTQTLTLPPASEAIKTASVDAFAAATTDAQRQHRDGFPDSVWNAAYDTAMTAGHEAADEADFITAWAKAYRAAYAAAMQTLTASCK